MQSELAHLVKQSPPQRVQLDRWTYEVTSIIRTGGMGTVWLLRRPKGAPYNTVYGYTRAVKTFNVHEGTQEAMLLQELGNWASLDRSHYIVPVIKIVRLNFEVGALMEVYPGSLADYIRDRHTLDKSTVAAVLLDVVHGLDDARRQGNIVHLDLKPQNLLIEAVDSPRVKISDWGLSRVISRDQDANWWSPKAWFGPQTDDNTQFAGGTLQYMAPERFSGSWTIGPAADMFSLGVIGVQLLTRQIPTKDGIHHPIELVKTREYMTRARWLLRGCERPLASLILQMLDPDPTRRPSDYEALIASLKSI